ncbi:hypothetical protein E2C01_004180 [Portunus trituberculatus]|uniref:Uncharacterized protein n=1 Tax=Portunus trituberculatus TaxID=210409 RepID=A0A5B7CVN4_PORTR|nr:hypothetical protein [Portunus trituberculatus]
MSEERKAKREEKGKRDNVEKERGRSSSERVWHLLQSNPPITLQKQLYLSFSPSKRPPPQHSLVSGELLATHNHSRPASPPSVLFTPSCNSSPTLLSGTSLRSGQLASSIVCLSFVGCQLLFTGSQSRLSPSVKLGFWRRAGAYGSTGLVV